jgi:hypothetical protein
MPNISKDLLNQAIHAIKIPHDFKSETLAKLQGLLDQPEGEPVAWYTDDHLTDRSAATYSKDMMRRWQDKGWPVTPLYTHPAPFTPITAEDITSEMHTEWIKIFTESNLMCCPKDGVVMAAAVNAYIGAKK